MGANLDIKVLKDPSKISKPVRFGIMAGIFVVSLAAGFFFDTDAEMSKLEDLKNKEKSLQTTWLDKKNQAVNLDAYKKQLKEIEVTFSGLLQQLPNKSEMDSLLNDINQAGIGRGLSFQLFRPLSEVNTDNIAEMPVSVTVTGSFNEIGLFAEDVSKLNRIVHLDNFDLKLIQSGQNGTSKLVLDGTAKTFRYQDKNGGKK